MIRPETGATPYQHWVLTLEPPLATLRPSAPEGFGADGCDSADIELCAAVQRLRFEHPEVATVVISGVSGRDFTEIRRARAGAGPAGAGPAGGGLRILVDRTGSPPFFAGGRQQAMVATGSAGRGPASEAVQLGPLWPEEFDGGFAYPNVRVEVDEHAGVAALTIVGPPNHECFAPEPGPRRLRSRWWPLAVCRELDDAVSRLRDAPGVRRLVMHTEGDALAVASADVALTSGFEHDWFVTEVVLYWRRMLARLDEAQLSLSALVEPGGCFVGTLLELALAAGQVSVADGVGRGGGDVAAEIRLTGMNFGPLPMVSGMTRLESRFAGRDGHLASLARRVGDPISVAEAVELGLFGRQPEGSSGTSR